MSKYLPKSPEGRALTIAGAVMLGVLLLFTLQRTVFAATYSTPYWANNSGSMESPIPSVAGLAMVREGEKVRADSAGAVQVDVRTGEVFWDFVLFATPGVLQDNVFALRWRSMISGSTQFGNGMLPSWETTVEYVEVDPLNPNATGGHNRIVRRPSGRLDTYVWDGSAYTKPTGVFDALTLDGSGNAVLTDIYGNSMTFDSRGMPGTYEDRNGNESVWTYNSSYQWTGLADDRGKTYTISRDGNGFVTSITDPGSRQWTMTYDTYGNLTSIKTPATTDQPLGITTTLGYDGYNRLTSVTNGRTLTVFEVAYSGATGVATTVTVGGDDVDYSYASGVTTRTDRNGNDHKYYFSGQQVTQTETIVDSSAEYVTLYRYSGIWPANIAFPRGNRVDFTFDGVGNLTARRHRTADTATNDSSDILHQWGYTSNFLTSYTDPLGNQTTYGRDAAGNLTSVTHPTVTSPASQSASRSYTRNGKGQVTQLTDEEGHVTTYTYYLTGSSIDLLQLVQVDPTGLDLQTIYTYDTCGNVATVTDPNGNQRTLTWDAVRRLTADAAPSALGYVETHAYDAAGNLVESAVKNYDKDGSLVTANPWITTACTFTTTDDLATVTEEIDASTTRTTNMDYDANQNRIRVTKPEGNKDKWEFNARDWVVKFIRGEGATEVSEEEYEYDDNGNRITVIDGRDNETDITYDLFDRPTKVTNALGHYTEREYDKNGNVTKVTRKNSSNAELQRESYYFDERNRHWKTSALFKDPASTYSDAVTTIARLKTGQPAVVTNPRGKDTTYAYDAALRLTSVTDELGNEISYTLDDNGNRTAWSVKEYDSTTPITHNYEATYDQINRRLTYVEIDRNNSANRWTTQSFYDSRSNLAFQINAEGNPTRWTFDGLNRMTKKETALTLGSTINDFSTAQVTQWGFDDNDRLVSHKDDGTHESTWAYDALDRPTTMTYPDSSTVGYEYDECDNVVELTDPAGNVIADTFDDLNRNTSRSITLATGFIGTTSETRTFDGVNRMLTNEDNDYKLEFQYAVIGLKSFVYQETQSYVGMTAYSKSVTKTYDANGNKVTEAYPSGASLSLAYGYDDIDQLTSIGDGSNTIASYSYVGWRKKGATLQNGTTRTNSYTGFRNEIESIVHATSTPTTFLRLDYGYNKVHDRLYERYGSSGSPGDAFAYDKMRRLTNAWMGSSTPSSPVGNTYTKKIDYNYDDDGNRTSVIVTLFGESPQTTSYTSNTRNEYTNVGGTSRSHDANGNLTDNGTVTFHYDYKNLLVQVKQKSSGSLIASYRYDALGRRVEKNAGAVERYVLSDGHLVAVFDGSDGWLQNHVWSGNDVVILEQADMLDYDADANVTERARSFYHLDASNRVVEITDLNGSAVVSYRYGPYGEVTISRGGVPQATDPLGQHWGLEGGFLDEETGLWHVDGTGYFDPQTGRTLSLLTQNYTVGLVSLGGVILASPGAGGAGQNAPAPAQPQAERRTVARCPAGQHEWEDTTCQLWISLCSHLVSEDNVGRPHLVHRDLKWWSQVKDTHSAGKNKHETTTDSSTEGDPDVSLTFGFKTPAGPEAEIEVSENEGESHTETTEEDEYSGHESNAEEGGMVEGGTLDWFRVQKVRKVYERHKHLDGWKWQKCKLCGLRRVIPWSECTVWYETRISWRVTLLAGHPSRIDDTSMDTDETWDLSEQEAKDKKVMPASGFPD